MNRLYWMSITLFLAALLQLVQPVVSLAQPGTAAANHRDTGVQVSEKDLEGTVEVSFRIDASGKVQILSMSATSPQLADYVIKKLNKIQLEKGDPQIGQVIKYRFVFKKQA